MLNPFFYIQAILLALRQIWINKTRSFLTALGIIIAVASVTSVIAALSGLKGKVLSEFEAFGASKMFILHDRPPSDAGRRYSWREVRMKIPELQAIAEHCPSIERLTPSTGLSAQIQIGTEVAGAASATGIWPDWHVIENRDVLIGRPFTMADVDNARQVCLINESSIKELRLDRDPTGQHILLNNRRFLIIGVVEDNTAGMFQPDRGSGGSDVEMFIPFSTATRMQGRHFFFMIIAKIISPDVAEEAKAEVTFTLRKMRGLEPGEPNTFRVEAIDQFIQVFMSIAALITGIAGGIVGISLLVGGIGIMNIMLVSVSERTREIGLRKAVGATPAAILMQFLLEAVTLCLVGGLVGIVGGETFAFALSQIPGVELEHARVPWWAVVMSFGFCGAVGVGFGMFPAIKASRLDPIDALRHE